MTPDLFESPVKSRSSSIDGAAIDWRRFLGRPLHRDPGNVAATRNETVLITGAGGSIGSALARRLVYEPGGRLVLVDNSRHRLKALESDLKARHIANREVQFFPGDIREPLTVQRLFSTFRPHTMFHAAALKHLVPLESDPFTALQTNLFGTSLLLEQANLWKTPLFINVSTDKAVRPTSVLGISKRIAERILLASELHEGVRVSVRFGNVLGSSDSVVPLFLTALHQRESLRITHPSASRYFMTLAEVVAVLLRCTDLPNSSLLLPDMGSERRIVDLAHFLMESVSIRTAIEYMGLRDGEKCAEALTYSYEHLQDTVAPGISRILGNSVDPGFPGKLDRLHDVVCNRRGSELIDALTSIEPEFAPSPGLFRYLSSGRAMRTE